MNQAVKSIARTVIFFCDSKHTYYNFCDHMNVNEFTMQV